jgi:argininosuccinate lyase
MADDEERHRKLFELRQSMNEARKLNIAQIKQQSQNSKIVTVVEPKKESVDLLDQPVEIARKHAEKVMKKAPKRKAEDDEEVEEFVDLDDIHYKAYHKRRGKMVKKQKQELDSIQDVEEANSVVAISGVDASNAMSVHQHKPSKKNVQNMASELEATYGFFFSVVLLC